MNKVYFIGAGPGDPELVTVKAKRIIEQANTILYTGSLVPKEVLQWANDKALVRSSENMGYTDIYHFIEQYVKSGVFVRLHTGDTSIYSTIAKQISFLESKNIEYEVIPGVTSAFSAAASLGIEYTIPGVSQTLILSRVEGRTPNPEALKNILNCKHSSLVFYLSITLINKLVDEAIELDYPNDTPCWVIEKASWPEETVLKGTLADIRDKLKDNPIKGNALIILGEFLSQNETESSHLYSKKYADKLKSK